MIFPHLSKLINQEAELST